MTPAVSDIWALLVDTTVSVAVGIAVGLLLASRFRITRAHAPNTESDNDK